MKGGALVGEQFDRMLAAVPKVRPHDAPAWVRYLTGFWLSGFAVGRIGCTVMGCRCRRLPLTSPAVGHGSEIRGEAQKSGQDELLPMTPDFAELILQTPEH